MRHHTPSTILLFVTCWAICAVLSPCYAQITFERSWGENQNDHGWSVLQNPDGRHTVVGIMSGDSYFAKTDSSGHVILERRYDGGALDFAHCVQPAPENAYAIAGLTTLPGSTMAECHFLLTDSMGVPIREKTYGGLGEDWFEALQQTQEGAYIAAGYRFGDTYIVLMDSLGDSIWARIIQSPDTADLAHSIIQASDGAYVVVGEMYPPSPYSFEREAQVFCLDSLGTLLWQKCYGFDWSQDFAYSIIQTPDSGYAICAYSESLGGAWLIKTDALGETLWTRTYDLSVPYSIIQCGDGGYVLGGTGVSGAYLLKTDSMGSEVWRRTYGFGAATAACVKSTPDGGYVFSGSIYISSDSWWDIYLVKTDGDGIVQRDAGVVTIDAPLPDTVLTDSTYPVMATVHNYRPSFVFCWVKATIGGYVDSVHTGRLDPDSSVQVTFADWTVPPDDSTAYTLTICTYQADDVDSTNDCLSKSIFAYNPVGVEEQAIRRPLNLHLGLNRNHPNPFHRSTVISYSLPSATQVTLSIYDITGRVVETLVKETQQPGIHQVNWNRKSNPSGVYFYRLRAGEFVETRKMVVVE